MKYPGVESFLQTRKRNTPMQKISCTVAAEIFYRVTNENLDQLLALN